MAFIPAPARTVRHVLDFTVQGQQCLNVIYTDHEGAITFGDLEALADAVFDAWEATLLGNQAAEITFNQVTSTVVTTAGGLQAVSTQAAVNGLSANPSINNALAGVVTLRTAQSGRSHQGRLFVAGLRDDELDGDTNYWTVPFTTELQNDTTALLAALNAITTTNITQTRWVVTSYYSGTNPDGTPTPRATAVNTPITGVTAKRRIGTQRRRRPRS